MAPRTVRSVLCLVLLATVLLLAGCRAAMRSVAAKYPAPSLQQVYRASEMADLRNPLVVVPGFAGSELRLPDDRVVWGQLFDDDFLPWDLPEGLRALALDVDLELTWGNFDPQEMRRLAAVGDDVTARGPLLHMRTDVGVKIDVSVYAALLEALARAGYRLVPGSLAETLQVPANPGGPPCYTFAFDWRRDLPSSAALLARFVDRVRAEEGETRRAAGVDEPVRVDLIGHSMGGLVTRYFLRYGARDVLGEPASGSGSEPIPWTGSDVVDRMILVATPNRGTATALRNLANGRNSPVLPSFEPALVATWVSVPQMFPRPADEPLLGEDGEPAALDYFDVGTWREHRWGPFAERQERFVHWIFPEMGNPDEGRPHLADFLASSLHRGERFMEHMDRPADPPPWTTIHLFTGDSEPTLARGRVLRDAGRLVLDFGASQPPYVEPGDGSVTRHSALADLRPRGHGGWLRASVPWHSAVFVSDRHGGFLRNEVFQDNLLHLLLERPPMRLENAAPQT